MKQAVNRDADGGATTVANTEFYGWKAITLRNRAAEIVVVPDLGRVMQFGLLDERIDSAKGPFWNHPRIGDNVGGHLLPDSDGWTNYGGDKAWPAPQSEWRKVAGRGWPPPKAFDAQACTATVKDDKVQLVSVTDPDYGIRVRRTIGLDPRASVMTIETTYEKLQNTPVTVSVWTITQLAPPDRLFVLLPPRPGPKFPNSYISLLPDAPAGLKTDGRLLSISRDPRNKTMIGSDGHSLLWVGNGPDLLIEDKTPDSSNDTGDWPNDGARSQIYTSPGHTDDDQSDQTYVELEILGRLHNLKTGGKATLRTTYTLIRRTETDPLAEAKKVFAQP